MLGIVYKYIFCLTKNEDITEEIVQDTFLEAVKRIKDFKGECKISTWLCQIAKYKWYQKSKKRKKNKEISLENMEDSLILDNCIEDDLCKKEDKLELFKRIQTLDEITRDVMYLRILGNLDYQEIAEIMGKTANWARVIFFRGKQMRKRRIGHLKRCMVINKKECDIVQDLLFSYNDGILSNTSKELVEKHLKNCDICLNKLKEIRNEDVKLDESQDKQVDYLKKIRKKLNKRKIYFIISITLLVILIVINILVFAKYNNVANKVEVYLEDDITSNQLSKIEEVVLQEDNEAKITYNSKEDELEEMKKIFQDNANLLSGYEGENNIFPASYLIETSVDKVEKIEKKLENLEGVKNIITNKEINPYVMYFLPLFTGENLYGN